MILRGSSKRADMHDLSNSTQRSIEILGILEILGLEDRPE